MRPCASLTDWQPGKRTLEKVYQHVSQWLQIIPLVKFSTKVTINRCECRCSCQMACLSKRNMVASIWVMVLFSYTKIDSVLKSSCRTGQKPEIGLDRQWLQPDLVAGHGTLANVQLRLCAFRSHTKKLVQTCRNRSFEQTGCTNWLHHNICKVVE